VKDFNSVNIKIHNISKLDSVKNYRFVNKSRYLKALSNISKGYETFVLIRDNEVIGDCWFATSLEADRVTLHPDLELFGINPVQKSAYMFDMYVKPEERGTDVTTSILKYAYNNFKDRGIEKVYTYVMAENTPAIWMVRILGFKELKKLRMRRFLFFKRVDK
jgi:GNAT superfamily N-acetyltransferase